MNLLRSAGETDLRKLLASMEPQLAPAEMVFCCVTPEAAGGLTVEPEGWFREAEGVTLILDRRTADAAGLGYGFVARRITLSVHSSLSAVGFLATVASRLAAAGISVNPVAGYYHDHLFVPAERATEALALLWQLSRDAAA